MAQAPTDKSAKDGDYASGWWGEEQARDGVSVPGPYGRKPEASPKAPDLNKRAPPGK